MPERPSTAAASAVVAAGTRRLFSRPEREAAHAATLQALDTLRYAERMLATGDSDGVDDELTNAEATLSGRTRLDVEAAREALANENLYPARQISGRRSRREGGAVQDNARRR